MAQNENESLGSGQDRSQQRAVSVFTAHDDLEADMIKQFLSGCGIECVVQGRVVSSIYPNLFGPLGDREILVLEDDVEDARELLAGWDEQGASSQQESE